jgi:hypothetical protein
MWAVLSQQIIPLLDLSCLILQISKESAPRPRGSSNLTHLTQHSETQAWEFRPLSYLGLFPGASFGHSSMSSP